MARKKKYLLTDDALRKEMRRLRRAEQWGRVLRGTVIILVAAFAVAIFMSTQRYMLVEVHGTSMDDTLPSGSVVLCELGVEPQRGELALFSYQDALLIRRVIGVGGDEVSVGEEGVTVNGGLLDEAYAAGDVERLSDIDYPVRVPPDKLFLMGDNRNVSVDSRSSAFGTIASDDVLARPRLVIWPLFRAGKLGG